MGGRQTKVNVDELNEAQLRDLVPDLLMRIAQLERMLFARRSEKSRYLDATDLLPFAELDELREQAAAAEKRADAIRVEAHERKRTKRRKEFPAHLPRYRTECTLSADELACPDCCQQREEFGEETSQELERLEITFVHEIAKKKYACRSCGGHVVTADGPERVLDKCLLGGGFLAQIIFDRFGNHMPYARLEKKYAAEGLDLSRSVLCSSAMRCAELLKPVYDAHVEAVLESLETSVLQVDDTYATQRNGREPGQKSIHVWAWRDQHAGVFYKATECRNRGSPLEILSGRSGRLQSDGHDCYNDLDPGTFTRAGCWAHLRRYFEKARRLGDSAAEKPLEWIGKVFGIERQAKKGVDGRPLTDDELVALRQRESAPIVSAMKAWLEHARLEPPGLPKGPLMEGVRYGLNQWPTLVRFLEDGRIREVSNNGCERALRAVVVGRKNWLFFGSEEGTDASLILLSLVQSCREHGISPLLYLREVLRAVSSTPASQVGDLTPLGYKRRKQQAERHLARRQAIDSVVRDLVAGY